MSAARMSALVWHSDRIRVAMKRLTLEQIGVSIKPQMYRHIAIAIFRRYCASEDTPAIWAHTRSASLAAFGWNSNGGDGQDMAHDLQAGHSSHISELTYARELSESLFSTSKQRALFRRVSTAWHRFLLFESTICDSDGVGRSGVRRFEQPALLETEAQRLHHKRRLAMKFVDLDEQLRVMFGPNARFRGVQQAAIGPS